MLYGRAAVNCMGGLTQVDAEDGAGIRRPQRRQQRQRQQPTLHGGALPAAAGSDLYGPPAGSGLYGRLAVSCMGGWAVICMGDVERAAQPSAFLRLFPHTNDWGYHTNDWGSPLVRPHTSSVKTRNSGQCSKKSLESMELSCKWLAPAPKQQSTVTHRLGWIRLRYGEMTKEFRAPSDHLESLHFRAHQT